MKKGLSFALLALLALLLICLALGGCTAEQRAQRHLKKALRLDPKIIQTYNVDTTIRGKVDTVVTWQAPEIDRSSIYYTMDSLRGLIGLLQDNPKGNTQSIYLYKDSTTSIQVKRQDGKLAVAFHVEPMQHTDTLSVPYEVRVIIPGKTIRVEVTRPAWRYFWFWVMAVALLLGLILLVKGRIKDGPFIVNNPGKG